MGVRAKEKNGRGVLWRELEQMGSLGGESSGPEVAGESEETEAFRRDCFLNMRRMVPRTGV
jgi:hypothetical protein